jgi:hypothetical protein
MNFVEVTEPVFQGTPGYTPLPKGFPWEKMTEKQKTDQIRHYLTIAESRSAWLKSNKAKMGNFLVLTERASNMRT